tara:strand:+ start:51508 stop:52491 length:984 start_codon:yes stop_codon:yes gene_type:complete
MTTATWQQQLRDCITQPSELIELLGLSQELSVQAQAALKQFPLRVPHSFVARMKKGDANDPLLRQVLPIAAELEDVEGFTGDPVGDLQANKLPGLIHKYHGRVLLTVAGACGVNCRYCFRREFPYADNNPGRKGWQPVLDYFAADNSIEEVIYSGGDPLIANDKQLAELTQQIADIKHIKRLRIHTRMPIVIPERVTDELLQWFTGSRLQPIMVVHCNHANEIGTNVKAAMQSLKQAGVTLLNQSVLLQGVNDSAEALVNLSQALFDADILPYYLHLLDKVKGAAHFDVPKAQGVELSKAIANKLPGYLVPKLVREQEGELSKIIVR